MAWRIELAPTAETDLDELFDYLVASYVEFGDRLENAAVRAQERILRIRERVGRLADAPYRGTLHQGPLNGLRNFTSDKAIIWFRIDENAATVTILAIFFGSQDHIRRMQRRIIGQVRE